MQKISFTYKGEIMIHVLIIEDEPAIARGLSLLITKNYPDFQVLGICKNGRPAENPGAETGAGIY